MAQEQESAQDGRDTAGAFEAMPAGGLATPVSPAGGPGTGEHAEGGLPGWVRPGLIGLGVLTPLAALAVPPLRRQLARSWQARQVADTVQSGTQRATLVREAGAGRAAGALRSAQAAWHQGQAQRERQRAEQAERRVEQLLARQAQLTRLLEARPGRRGGAARRVGPFLVGALAAGGVGLLYAPRPGAETRAQLQERAGVAQGRVQETLGRVKEQAGGLQAQTREKLRPVAADRAPGGEEQSVGATGGG